MHSVVVFLAVVMATAVKAADHLDDPSDLALTLEEEEFENFLDEYLTIEELSWISEPEDDEEETVCIFKIRGDLGQPQPVYVHNNKLLEPAGNTGQVRVSAGQEIIIACPGQNNKIRHPKIISDVAFANATCMNGNLISGVGWLRDEGEFGRLTCARHPESQAVLTNEECFDHNAVIKVGYQVANSFYTSYHSCFNREKLEVLYVKYHLKAENALHQTRVRRPEWMAGDFYPGVNPDQLYSKARQKTQIAGIVGSNMVGRYITRSQYLARGHLTAKSDHPFASAQRATFFFINVAPQWQPFNAGNWNKLEQKLRARIAEADYNTVVYTGTFGVTELRDSHGVLQKIYLHGPTGNGKIPVPLYFYKVVIDEHRGLGTAFVSINNPYYTAAEVRSLQFCTDYCRNSDRFEWIGWDPDRIDLGYSFCCTINDFRRRIPHIPHGEVWQSAELVRRGTVGRFVTGRGAVDLVMGEVPEVVVEGCNGVDDDPGSAEVYDVAHQNGDDGLAIDPKLGCRVHFPSDVIRET